MAFDSLRRRLRRHPAPTWRCPASCGGAGPWVGAGRCRAYPRARPLALSGVLAPWDPLCMSVTAFTWPATVPWRCRSTGWHTSAEAHCVWALLHPYSRWTQPTSPWPLWMLPATFGLLLFGAWRLARWMDRKDAERWT